MVWDAEIMDREIPVLKKLRYLIINQVKRFCIPNRITSERGKLIEKFFISYE